jgi:hypothetical protein
VAPFSTHPCNHLPQQSIRPGQSSRPAWRRARSRTSDHGEAVIWPESYASLRLGQPFVAGRRPIVRGNGLPQSVNQLRARGRRRSLRGIKYLLNCSHALMLTAGTSKAASDSPQNYGKIDEYLVQPDLASRANYYIQNHYPGTCASSVQEMLWATTRLVSRRSAPLDDGCIPNQNGCR